MNFSQIKKEIFVEPVDNFSGSKKTERAYRPRLNIPFSYELRFFFSEQVGTGHTLTSTVVERALCGLDAPTTAALLCRSFP